MNLVACQVVFLQHRWIDAQITASEELRMKVLLNCQSNLSVFLSLSSDLFVMYIVIHCVLVLFIFHMLFTITYPAKLEVRRKEME